VDEITLEHYRVLFYIVAFLLRVTWCAVVDGEADGVEYGRFAAAHRADDAEDAAFAQDTCFKVDDFATYFV
jgi:hypothetical protein